MCSIQFHKAKQRGGNKVKSNPRTGIESVMEMIKSLTSKEGEKRGWEWHLSLSSKVRVTKRPPDCWWQFSFCHCVWIPSYSHSSSLILELRHEKPFNIIPPIISPIISYLSDTLPSLAKSLHPKKFSNSNGIANGVYKKKVLKIQNWQQAIVPNCSEIHRAREWNGPVWYTDEFAQILPKAGARKWMLQIPLNDRQIQNSP